MDLALPSFFRKTSPFGTELFRRPLRFTARSSLRTLANHTLIGTRRKSLRTFAEMFLMCLRCSLSGCEVLKKALIFRAGPVPHLVRGGHGFRRRRKSEKLTIVISPVSSLRTLVITLQTALTIACNITLLTTIRKSRQKHRVSPPRWGGRTSF